MFFTVSNTYINLSVVRTRTDVNCSCQYFHCSNVMMPFKSCSVLPTVNEGSETIILRKFHAFLQLMGLRERERQLAFLYGVGGCLSLVTIICSAVPWSHWEEILDTCVSARCGCILYGTQTFRTFNGGDISVCYFATLASVPAFIIAIIMAVYHGYRVCMFSKEENRATARMRRRYSFIISYTV